MALPSPHLPPLSSQGLTGRVVRELVLFSLCGQALLSHYCTHADAAAPPPPQPTPILVFFSETTNNRENYCVSLRNANQNVPSQRENVSLFVITSYK